MKESLNFIIMQVDGKKPNTAVIENAKSLLSPQDTLIPAATDNLSELPRQAEETDAIILTNVCGSTPLAQSISRLKLPCFALEPYHAFHSYQSTFYRDVERMGGIVLPARDPDEIAYSLQALRVKKSLDGTKLLLVNTHENDFRSEEVKIFSEGSRRSLKVEIIRRSVAELKEYASGYSDKDADKELKRWYSEILEGPGEMSEDHMRQVAKLYLSEKKMLEETGAAGITVEDIGGFLIAPKPCIMPNVSYGPLVFEGFIACEEGDVEVLTTELLLKAGLGIHPTMSNVYLLFRDRFDALASHQDYTSEMELADYRQCLADNRITLCHFSSAGVLPREMMEESRYKVRETVPAWPGQSMIVSTPKLGPVVMARLTPDASGIHVLPGKADKRSSGDKYGWYRNRWFIKIPDVDMFTLKALHPHYAVAPENKRFRVLEILLGNLLRLTYIK